MTTPKEALELKPCPFCGGEAVITQRGNNLYSTVYECTDCRCRLSTGETFNYGSRWNTRATASLQGEDAVERVAGCICQNQHRRGYCTEPGCPYSTSDAVEKVKALAHRFWSIHPSTIAAMNLTREEFYVREMMALLATGLVADEAVIRADSKANLISIIADIREKSGLGGKPMLNELADAIVAEMNRRVADEREKCAKVAEAECYATTGRQIAAAIRSNGRGA